MEYWIGGYMGAAKGRQKSWREIAPALEYWIIG